MVRGMFQFVSYFPEWQGLEFVRCTHGIALIYDWILLIGFWQIRRIVKDPKAALERHEHKIKAFVDMFEEASRFENWNRDKCRETHVQACHSCTSFDCCDNMNQEKK